MSIDSSLPSDGSPVGDPVGYSDTWSVAPGQGIRFMVSTSAAEYNASVVRLSGVKEAYWPSISAPINGRYTGRLQTTQIGSYVMVPGAHPVASLKTLTVYVWVWPTRYEYGREQVLVSTTSWSLVLDDAGRPRLRLDTSTGPATVRCEHPLTQRAWSLLYASFDETTGEVALCIVETGMYAREPETVTAAGAGELSVAEPVVWLAAGPRKNAQRAAVEGYFDGKLEAPTLFNRLLTVDELAHILDSPDNEPPSVLGLIAAWRFQYELSGDRVVDIGPFAMEGRAINAPARAMTGHRWRSEGSGSLQAPSDYGAIHFHSDDLEDAGWESDLTLTVPEDWPAGLYGVKLTTAYGARDIVPFVVTPGAEATADVVLVLPTMTYLAYANEKLPNDTSYSSYRTLPDVPISDWDDWLRLHPEMGMSLYDSHADGSGCCYSSRLRPIPAIRPDYISSQLGFARHLTADLMLVEWLVREGIEVDIVTDEDVHADGAELLNRYRVVLTGSHPEYVSASMLNAIEGYIAEGGRLMYLGGNGFCWVTSLSSRGHLIEVRRGQTNQSPWDSRPGELHHSTTGELGGLWELRGRAPRSLLGVGTCALGLLAHPYRRTTASYDPRYSWIFDGVPEDDEIGTQGRILGAAGGYEIDSFNPALGSPAQTVHLARSHGEDKDYELITCGSTHVDKPPKGGAPYASADLTFLHAPNGGAVFSVGSVAWIGSLLDSASVSVITRNVLNAFRSVELPVS